VAPALGAEMRVVMRADATPALGWGHLKRCLALAAALRERGAAVWLVGRGDGQAVAAAVAAQGAHWLPLPSVNSMTGNTAGGATAPQRDALDTLATMAAAGVLSPELLLVDHYALAATWHHSVRRASGARIVAIDDLADRPLAPDLLIDHNLSADHAAKYAAVLPAGVPICGGPGFALLDPAYRRLARPRLRPQLRRLGLFMGGSDPFNHSAWALQLLRQRCGWQGAVQIATTSANPHRAALQALANALNAELLCDLPNLAAFHAGCDLQIGAGGGALWERCSLGVPTVALVCADNQRQSVPALAAIGAVLGLDAVGQTAAQADTLVAAVCGLLAAPERRAALRKRSLALVDGLGAQRVVDRMLALLHADIAVSA